MIDQAPAVPRLDGAAVTSLADGSSSTREAWLEASVELGAQLLHVEDAVVPVVRAVVEHVSRLVRARTVTFVGPSKIDEGHFEVRLAVGAGADDLMGKTYTKTGTLEGRTMQENRGFVGSAGTSHCHHQDTRDEQPAGPLLAVPLDGPGGMRGAIVASRWAGQAAFSEFDLAMAQDFARQSSIALRLAQGQASSEQLRFHEQREAELHQLHDDLIQQLFGLGVTLESLRKQAGTPAGQPAPGPRWDQATGQIDGLIAQLRATLTAAPDADG
ncbi:Histidine kinase [Friedmanniella luteola]|uniref:Histidine kinase n=1 Tax=Friedmanniella luteola TaxID=546871 RepID=A0A1H1LIK3_9ACTN|nr:histidine kinase [Friedmanniella luteola]SDR74373.1 Histidine kinase [Friedmanniella luteola]